MEIMSQVYTDESLHLAGGNEISVAAEQPQQQNKTNDV